MKKILLFLTLFTGMTLTGCNDSFLEIPRDQLDGRKCFPVIRQFQSFHVALL